MKCNKILMSTSFFLYLIRVWTKVALISSDSELLDFGLSDSDLYFSFSYFCTTQSFLSFSSALLIAFSFRPHDALSTPFPTTSFSIFLIPTFWACSTRFFSLFTPIISSFFPYLPSIFSFFIALISFFSLHPPSSYSDSFPPFSSASAPMLIFFFSLPLVSFFLTAFSILLIFVSLL